jgi:acetyl-CoA/propionyl-CoA carboxylase biotin carboxyl carrier protein
MDSQHNRPFDKVLVANRAEIAVRVIRACQELGIATVAVYSELDRHALHVRLADEAYALGGETAAESYLNTDAILDVIQRSGADAVHPGYGFFSENADFARAITDRGVTFIGPPPEAIEVMGDKISAREAAEKVGVDGVPGNTQFLTGPEEIVAFGEANGWPVAIKAAFGGGGRGMKVVTSEAEVADALESARREAKAYFGRDECYVEKYLAKPRHIEVQVLCDSHGNGIYVGQRDCSAQRRHQKLIEEAPAPGLDPEVEAAMGEAAVKVAKGCNYTNAGTVEFLYEDGEFFYLEMNTRLQVEHPVTEMVSGLDLVALQLSIAAGDKLPLTQDEVALTGHAIEVRINAEDPAGGQFLPSPGPITRLRAPSGFGVRWDGGYESGDEVSQFYDNLVGKLICWGADRDIAIARTIRALGELEIEGVKTTIPADLAILAHDDFAKVNHSTKWVEDELDLSDATAAPSAPATDDVDGEEEPRVRRDVDVEVNGKRFQVSMWVPESAGSTAAGGGSKKPKRRASAGAAAAGTGSGDVVVPMQGTVVKVLVEQGQEIEAGETVLVLEAMKMENNVTAERSGTVSEVKVAAGDSVSGGDVVVVIG